MKTNTTISSSIIVALLMMMLFSHASHAATIIPQNGTVAQLTPVYYEETEVYYAEALADVETLVRFFLYLFPLSLFFSAFSKKWTTDRKRCAKVRCNRARRERLALVVVIIVSRRARLFLDSLWMMMMMMMVL